jgi:UDP-N-acetylglucosamine/UDP-N-acetylgalactosamine diphosphorylase
VVGAQVAKAPDGNGGLYMSLLQSGTLAHMRGAGVQCLDCYCVDNVLVRPGDPSFLGYCWEQRADAGTAFATV